MGSWEFLADHEGSFSMVLLTDGSVLCQSRDSAGGMRLHPNENGDYSSGRWAAPHRGDYLSGDALVLADGRVFRTNLTRAEVFDPVTNLWQTITPDARLGVGRETFIFSALCVMHDRRVLVSLHDSLRARAAIYDPTSNTWTETSEPIGNLSRGILLPNNAVITKYFTQDEIGLQIYWPERNEWSRVARIDARSLGPLLPDGRVLVGTDRIMFFTPPSSPGETGVLHEGPAFPSSDSRGRQFDGPRFRCLLPSGRVFCSTRYLDPGSPRMPGGEIFFEFDPESGALHFQDNPRFRYGVSHPHSFRFADVLTTLLPSGQVLVNVVSTDINVYAIYTPDLLPVDDLWRPQIRDCSFRGMGRVGQVVEIEGVQFNGISQAGTYNATNYPIVQLKNRTSRPGRIWHGRTFDHSTMGVATGDELVRTRIAFPPDTPSGPVQIRVVANGIPSEWCETFIDDPYFVRDALIPIFWNQLIGNLADGPFLAIGPDGKLRPVPPWNPLTKELAIIYGQLGQLMNELRVIGQTVFPNEGPAFPQFPPDKPFAG